MQILRILSALSVVASVQGAAPKGLKIQWVGHSFHMFLPGPVAKLAKEAGIQGHTDVGKDMLGGSSPCEHWNRAYPEAKQVGGFVGGGMGKTAGGKDLRRTIDAGIPDVVTLSTQQAVPEPCIEKFALKFVSSLCSSPLSALTCGCTVREEEAPRGAAHGPGDVAADLAARCQSLS
jgi:hypothetical protein